MYRFVCTHIYICIYLCMFIRTYIYLHMYINICMYMYIYICLYAYSRYLCARVRTSMSTSTRNDPANTQSIYIHTHITEKVLSHLRVLVQRHTDTDTHALRANKHPRTCATHSCSLGGWGEGGHRASCTFESLPLPLQNGRFWRCTSRCWENHCLQTRVA